MGASAGPVPPIPVPAQVLTGAESTEPSRAPRHTARVLGGAVAGTLLALLGLAMVAVVGRQTGVPGFLLGSCLALVPVPLVLGAFLWVDRHEPEPPLLLAFAFAWGAVVATFLAAVANGASMSAIARASDQDSSLARTAVFVAPFVEEASKGLGILVILLARRREFDGVVDGIVCAGFVGIGFAFTENVLYYGRAYLEADAATPGTGVWAAGATFVLRGVFSPFAHPLFTLATGVGLGVASQTASRVRRLVAPVAGYLVAVALHALWNESAVSGLEGFARGYVLYLLPLFVVAGVGAGLLSNRERRLIERTLPAYARVGWLPAYDVEMVASPAGRRRARRWAASTQGPQARRAMAAYQEAASEVALLRWRAAAGYDVPEFADREAALLRDLARARTSFRPVLRRDAASGSGAGP